MQFREVTCQKAMTKLNSKHQPYSWDLNIYRGCSHRCQYCFAIYSHQYLEHDAEDFFETIHVKTNVVDALEQQLRVKAWKQEVINLGGVTDSYQAAERKYQLMPDIIRLLIKYKTPAIISTKSDLILRDFDLWNQLSQVTAVNIASTIISYDAELLQKIEPGAPSPQARMAMLREFRKTNAAIGVHIMPIIPYINDDARQMAELLAAAKAAGVDYVLPGTLYLRGSTKPHFLKFIHQTFPEHHQALVRLYNNREQRQLYKRNMYQILLKQIDDYRLSRNYMAPLQSRMPKQSEQLRLVL